MLAEDRVMSTVVSKIVQSSEPPEVLHRTPVASGSVAATLASNAHSCARLLTVAEVATILHVHPNRVYELASRRAIPIVRVGRLLRFHVAALQSWIESGGTQGEECSHAAVHVAGRG
jgi:excisionase family DNA binding protein